MMDPLLLSELQEMTLVVPHKYHNTQPGRYFYHPTHPDQVVYSVNTRFVPRNMPVDETTNIRVRSLMRPRQFSHDLAWAPFVPLRPFAFGRFFASLQGLSSDWPVHTISEHKHRLEPTLAGSWLGLQHQLQLIAASCTRLVAQLGQVDWRAQIMQKTKWPVLPASLGFLREHDTIGIVRQRAELSHMAFQAWIAFITFLFALLPAPINEVDVPPLWYTDLQSRGFSNEVLSELRQALLLRSGHRRLGTFLNLSDFCSSTVSPLLDIFVEFHLPMYYSWDRAVVLASSEFPILREFEPMRDARKWKHSECIKPLPSKPPPAPQSVPSRPTSIGRATITSHCEEFLDYVAAEEYTFQRQSPTPADENLARLRQFLVEVNDMNICFDHSHVMEWLPSPGSNDGSLYPQLLYSSQKQERFHAYPREHRHYEARSNRWHLCRAMTVTYPEHCPPLVLAEDMIVENPVDELERAYDEVDVNAFGPDLSTIDLPAPMQDLVPAIDPSVFTVSDAQPPSDIVVNDTFVRWLTRTYGYVPPSSRPAFLADSATIPSRTEWNQVRDALGAVDCISSDPIPDDAMDVLHFFRKMQTDPTGRHGLCDLFAEVHEGRLDPTTRSKGITRIMGPPKNPRDPSSRIVFFKISWETASPRQWNLFLYRAADAVHVYRCRFSNIVLAAWYCLQQGIAFASMGTDKLLKPVEPSDPRPSWCLTGYREPVLYINTLADFNAEHYSLYEQHCKSLLARPSGRAALCAGGILNRIARDYIPFEVALDGPSTDATRFGLHWGFNVRTSHYTGPIFDDKVTPDVGFALCGRYVLRKFFLSACR